MTASVILNQDCTHKGKSHINLQIVDRIIWLSPLLITEQTGWRKGKVTFKSPQFVALRIVWGGFWRWAFKDSPPHKSLVYFYTLQSGVSSWGNAKTKATHDRLRKSQTKSFGFLTFSRQRGPSCSSPSQGCGPLSESFCSSLMFPSQIPHKDHIELKQTVEVESMTHTHTHTHTQDRLKGKVYLEMDLLFSSG